VAEVQSFAAPDRDSLAPAAPAPAALDDLLVERGALTPEHLAEARATQAELGGRIGDILVATGRVPPTDVVAALAAQAGVPFRRAADCRPEPDVVRRLPADEARRLRVVPLRTIGSHLELLTADPRDADAIAAVQRATGLSVLPVAAPVDDVDALLWRTYPAPVPSAREVAVSARAREAVRAEQRLRGYEPRAGRRAARLALLFALAGAFGAVVVLRAAELVGDPIVGAYGVLVLATPLVVMYLALAHYRDPSLRAPPDHPRPLTSLLVAVRDEEDNIDACVESLTGQSFAALEVIVVDDCSTDGTRARLLALKARHPALRLMFLEANVGKKRALVAGLREAHGEILCFTDSDCILDAHAVEHVVEAFGADERIGAVSGHARALNADRNVLTKTQDAWYDGQFGVWKAAESVFGAVTCISGPLAAFRRAAVWNFFPAWADDRFLGQPFPFSTDRQLTAYVLGADHVGPALKERYRDSDFVADRHYPDRTWRIEYVRRARAWTIVPWTPRRLMRQQLRWKKSFIRNLFFTGGFYWSKGPVPAFIFYSHVLFVAVAPLMAFRHLVYLPFFVGALDATLLYLGAIVAKGFLWSFAFHQQNPGSRRWMYRPLMSLLNAVAFSPLLIWAALTIRRRDWVRATVLLAAVALFVLGGAATRAQAAVPVVSIEFDDGRAEQAAALPLLRERGLHATFFVPAGAVGKPGSLSRRQLLRLQAAGNEIGGHTLSHVRLAGLDPVTQQREVCGSRVVLAGYGLDVTSFAYPWGMRDERSRAAVVECGYTSARDVGGIGCSGCPLAESIPPVDPFVTRAPTSVQSTTTLATIQDYVTRAAAAGGWVQIVLHRLCDGCDPEAMSLPAFAALLDWLAAERDAGRVRVQTVRDVIAQPERPLVAPIPVARSPLNLLANGALERADAFGVPVCWQGARTGTSTGAVERSPGAGRDGGASERLVISRYRDGDVKLISKLDPGLCAPAVRPGRRYALSAWLRGRGVARLIVFRRAPSGRWSFFAQGDEVHASRRWRRATLRIPALPRLTQHLAVGVSLRSRGSVLVDDVRLWYARPPRVQRGIGDRLRGAVDGGDGAAVGRPRCVTASRRTPRAPVPPPGCAARPTP